MRNKKYKEFSAGRAGNGSINLATGALTFVHEDMGSDANILPINISHVYSSTRAADSNITYGKGFRLNLQQTLKKNDPKNDDDTKYTYTDASGTEHVFEDRYYYIGFNGKRNYLSTPKVISIGVDGKLTYYNGSKQYDVFTHQMTESGLTLQSEMKKFIGSKKLDTRHEDIVRLSEEISQLDKVIKDLDYNLKQYGKPEKQEYKDILQLQSDIDKESIAIEKESLTSEDKLYQRRSDLNIKKETLRSKKFDYDGVERTELRNRYTILTKRASEEKEKYTNLKANKEELLKQLQTQIPVNFIVDKDNVTLGFNADGNLVSLFDNYGNQVAIIYEDGVIVKVVDADDREILFEYETKSESKGKLMSITDYKGHKTSFIYGNNNEQRLTKIEYPNGDSTQFAYVQNYYLSKIYPPSKIGMKLDYTADHKVSNIAEITTAGKIDISGVSKGDKITENIAVLTYEGNDTIVRDVKNNISETNMFGAYENLHRVQIMENDKVTSFTAYDESSVSDTSKRCNFIMTSDDIAENGIPGMDIVSSSENNITLDGASGGTKEWSTDLTKLDPAHADYILCASATASQAEKTPKRKKTKYCEDHCEHDMNSTYRRFEYKVLVDYAGKTQTPPSEVYTPIDTDDIIKTIYLNQNFTKFPNSIVSASFGKYIVYDNTNYYPILGFGGFTPQSPTNQIYYTAKDYPLDGGLNYGCALWVGNTLLWCNQKYAEKEGITAGWKQSEIDTSTWGPIKVYRRDYLHSWGRFLSKNSVFHNGK